MQLLLLPALPLRFQQLAAILDIVHKTKQPVMTITTPFSRIIASFTSLLLFSITGDDTTIYSECIIIKLYLFKEPTVLSQ